MSKHSPFLLTAGVILATGFPSWGFAQQITLQQNDASSWIARVKVDDLGMAEARDFALESVTLKIADRIGIAPDRPQHEVLSKLLIVDETYAAASQHYSGTLRLVTAQPDPSYEVAERRTGAFDTPAAHEAWRPNWVLVVPFEIGPEGAWSLSGSSSPWASRWKVPFRDGLTQFLPATIDAEDRNMAAEAGSLEAVAEHLAHRYQSEAVMMVARDPDGLIEIGRWITGEPMDFSDLGSFDTSGSLIDLRARYLEAFWGGALMNGYPGLQDGVMAALEQAQTTGPVRYRLVGLPRPYGSGWEGHLQIILSGRSWEYLESEMQSIPGLNIVSVDDRGSSVLVRFVSESENVTGLLAAYGFSEG